MNWFIPLQPLMCEKHGRQTQYIYVPSENDLRLYCLSCAAELLLKHDIPPLSWEQDKMIPSPESPEARLIAEFDFEPKDDDWIPDELE